MREPKALPLTSDDLEQRLQNSPFHSTLGLRLVAFDGAAQNLTLRALFQPHVTRDARSGQYHGGLIASLIDIAGDFALIAVLGHGVPTINLRVDYLRPAANIDLVARAQVRRAGRNIGVVDIEVQDAAGRLIALGRGCYGTRPG